ncbi:transmembrane protein 94 isoform X2 [Cylas formicarius]|uniref:transmembrane protein 94 isoform X2 n=1 Tax=Cylas formicarius TaxID=197179 RepID=UPI0029583760|nr:transmembrane protein 94 isoform X2 [Cylas formicarius]
METGAQCNREPGLDTREAINKLCVEIESVLQQFEHSRKSRRGKSWVRDTFSHNSRHTSLNWISASFQLWASLSLALGYFMDGDNVELYEALIILLLLFINLSIMLYENKARHDEIPARVRMVLHRLKNQIGRLDWKPENYPNLYTPLSPCITLQWTYRNGRLVNLPWALLVKDDVILVKPGQVSPGYCEALDKHSEHPILHAKEVFSPAIQHANEIFSVPKTRRPLEAKKLLETPYLYNLKLSLEEALDRPVTQHNRERYFVMIKVVEGVVLPVVFVSVFLSNLFRYLYFHQYLGRYSVANMFFVSPSNAILPLLPLVFPAVWTASNYVGMARFRTIFEATRHFRGAGSAFEEDTDISAADHDEIKYSRAQMWLNFMKIVKADPEILCRSANILHVLGSVSALACVDKKGVLSWPNPTAEKIFFLANKDDGSEGSGAGNPDVHLRSDSPDSATVEVLDLTHTHNDPFRLRFDDQDWQRHLASLKPLGLAILLNTCNLGTQEHYSKFCSHIACEATYNENLVPVTNRRCLCELAKEIGFVDAAQKIFALEQQLSVFRHVPNQSGQISSVEQHASRLPKTLVETDVFLSTQQPEMVRKDNKYARTLHMSTRLKFPFPHAFSVTVREQLAGGSFQLLTEGTADIVLDCCVDYWDGSDLCPLTHTDRKKIQDFYQRSSLTAYCTAFAYRPLAGPVPGTLGDVYLELPGDGGLLPSRHRSPTPLDCKSGPDPKIKSAQFFSTDSLLCNDYPASVAENPSEAEACFQMHCNQIFIGMVTMQYQALADMVQLIEQLERACVRFVHFSKENELRSRVFSEKMGLESGWNCHISLLSERHRRDTPPTETASSMRPRLDCKSRALDSNHLESSRTVSFSAPSAINLEHSIVKFDSEVERFHLSRRQSENAADGDVGVGEAPPMRSDSVTHDWQSLSCLTDSTEQSAPINFDLSNRAKLPRGIDKIRPHIECIDNVPLLVSLFTDCTPSATREMLAIMQEYNEVVCILGSAQNCDNAGIFMQADAAVSVEPLYPQVCQKMAVFDKTACPSPTELSCLLNSIACSLTVTRSDPISLYHLIMEARHFGSTLWSSVQYWLCCSVALSFVQTAAVALMLPGPLTTGHTLWFAVVATPAVAVALSLRPVDAEVMKRPQGKIKAAFRWDTAAFILWCYGFKFLPTLLTALVTYVGVLAAHCSRMCSDPASCRCVFFYNPVADGDAFGGFVENSWTLITARLIVSFVLLLNFVVVSIGFVHRDRLTFRKSPHSNGAWLATVVALVCLQACYTVLEYRRAASETEADKRFDIPLWVILFAGLSPILVFVTNEFIKRQEIRVNKRFLKRARLDFGTKLGMNSPF